MRRNARNAIGLGLAVGFAWLCLGLVDRGIGAQPFRVVIPLAPKNYSAASATPTATTTATSTQTMPTSTASSTELPTSTTTATAVSTATSTPTATGTPLAGICSGDQPVALPQTPIAGVVHIAGDYRFTDGNFLVEGVDRLQAIGAPAAFVYLIPRDAAVTYPDASERLWPPAQPTSLAELARTAPYRDVLARPFQAVVLTTYTDSVYAPIVGTPPADGYAAEEQEFYELTKHLLTTYRGCGRVFVLKHWEGDSIIACKYAEDRDACPKPDDFRHEMSSEVAQEMIRWLQARQRGVTRARAELGDIPGVKVLHAVEVNQVVDVAQGKRRVLTAVVPHVGADMVAYSAWDAIGDDLADASKERTKLALRRAIDTIHRLAPDPLGLGRARVFISEHGLRENTLPLLAADAVSWCAPGCVAADFERLVEGYDGSRNPRGLRFERDDCARFELPAGVSADVWDATRSFTVQGPATLPQVCIASFRWARPIPTSGPGDPSPFDATWRTEAVLETAAETGLSYTFFWELYDNECRSPSDQPLPNERVALPPGDPERPTNGTCTGNWLIRPDGTESGAARALRRHWAGTSSTPTPKPTPRPLTPAEAQAWCAPNCQEGDFSSLRESDGRINPQGLKFVNAGCPRFHVPVGHSFDVWTGRLAFSASGYADLPAVCEASFRINDLVADPADTDAVLTAGEAATWCAPTCSESEFGPLYEQPSGAFNPRGVVYSSSNCARFIVPNRFFFDAWDGEQNYTVGGPADLPRVCAGTFRRRG